MMVQRYLCTRSITQARLALVSSGVVVLLQFGVFLLLGVGLYGFYLADPPIVRNFDEVFARFIVAQVPPGVRGLIIAAVFSAAMSTLSSSLNAVASAAVTDIYRPLFRRTAPELHYLNVSRVLTIAAGVLQMIVALAGQALPTESPTVNNVLTVSSFVTGITLGVLLLGTLVPRAQQQAAIVGMAFGAAAVLTVWLQAKNWLGFSIAWPWFSLIGSFTTLVAGTSAAYGIPVSPQEAQGEKANA
jgi:Na+/proline symporter